MSVGCHPWALGPCWHPSVTLHISPLGHGAGVQRHPRRCVYSSGAVPPRPDPIAMCSLKGFRKSQTESQSNASFHKSIFARRATSVYLHTLRFESFELSRLQTATMATHAHHFSGTAWQSDLGAPTSQEARTPTGAPGTTPLRVPTDLCGE